VSDTRLVLIRHGESRATVERYLGGHRSCTGLTEFGRLQSLALRERLLRGHDVAASALVASNFPRATETAKIIAPALGSLQVDVDAGWGEHDPGPDCDGMKYSDFVEKYGQPRWDGDPHDVVFPGGETIAQFHDRIMETVQRTVRNNIGGTVVIACHGGVIDAVMRNTLHMHQTGKFEMHTVNTSLTELVHVQGSKWRLIRYNDAAHLAGLSVTLAVTSRED
jgi:broad specificity phosphatase PhoE